MAWMIGYGGAYTTEVVGDYCRKLGYLGKPGGFYVIRTLTVGKKAKEMIKLQNLRSSKEDIQQRLYIYIYISYIIVYMYSVWIFLDMICVSMI